MLHIRQPTGNDGMTSLLWPKPVSPVCEVNGKAKFVLVLLVVSGTRAARKRKEAELSLLKRERRAEANIPNCLDALANPGA
ncbi:hypothetical protein GJ744_003323 [Endocarpon pusillum]|uniref:Uncharacterized protein n=1 Tax=Endocarpon pusillum TaxID=364733 RepID=A0A8H7DZW7_9EURO|nr:hypothetical protein GJ744_003323 [Endocarpon pusillum]